MRRRFQSTPSGGKATARSIEQPLHRGFQSTPSGGKATRSRDVDQMDFCVSIHAFRGEGDTHLVVAHRARHGFQSTPSGGKATGSTTRTNDRRRFNPRLPGGRRLRRSRRHLQRVPFQSTPSGGKATRMRDSGSARIEFQSTPSGGKATAISRAAVPCSRQIL